MPQVFGVKSKGNEGGVAATMCDETATTDRPSRREQQAPLGHSRPGLMAVDDARVHGIVSKRNEGGVSASLTGWEDNSKASRSAKQRPFTPDRVFGRPSAKRDENNMAALLSFRYGQQWMEEHGAKQPSSAAT